MAIRITSVGRVTTENSGYHPLRIAEINRDEVWAIPGKNKPVQNAGHIYVLLIEKILKNFLSLRLLRLLSLVEIYFRALFRRTEIFFVHSFIFAIPVILANCKCVLIIHGSDKKYLPSILGQFIGKRAVKVLGVGFGAKYSNYMVTEIPNVFDLRCQESVKLNESNNYDLAFVLRNSPVKNPSYPFEMSTNYIEGRAIRIAVIGIDENFVGNDKERKVKQLVKLDILGRRNPSFVASILANTHVMIIPSVSEGVSKAMLEAMSHGVHIITSETLHLPSEFEGYVNRINLYDWLEVANKVDELRAKGKNMANKEFVVRYLEKSEKLLSALYFKLSEDSHQLRSGD